MSVQVQKTQVKKDLLTNGKQNPLTKEEQELVDEIAALEKKLAPMRPLLKRYEEVKKVLASAACDDKRFDLTQTAILRGASGVVEFSPISNPREISDMHGLIGALKAKMGGYEKMLPIIKINLGDVDKYLTDAERAPFIGNKKGSRTLDAVRVKDE